MNFFSVCTHSMLRLVLVLISLLVDVGIVTRIFFYCLIDTGMAYCFIVVVF